MTRFQCVILSVITALGLLGIATGVAIAVAPNHFVKTDSGVAACKTISENMANSQSTKNNKKMTEASYKKARAPFENSSHADIKVAGMNIIDTIYQADTMKDPDNIGAAMILMNSLQSQWSDLQVACSKQGVDVPKLPTGS
jgi:flagellar basal body rod protein FlgC